MTEQQPPESLSLAHADSKMNDGGMFRVEPGYVCFTHLEKPPLETESGMMLAEAEDQKYDRVAFGVVTACGLYVERNLGTIVRGTENWLVPGALICHMYPNPTYVNLPGARVHFIRADQIVGHWKPGEWPKWAQIVQEWMLKNPEPFDRTVLSDPQKHRKLLQEKVAKDIAKNAELNRQLSRR